MQPCWLLLRDMYQLLFHQLIHRKVESLEKMKQMTIDDV
ncbi:hypothetical protein AAZX31_19G183200 [Glycine max]